MLLRAFLQQSLNQSFMPQRSIVPFADTTSLLEIYVSNRSLIAIAAFLAMQLIYTNSVAQENPLQNINTIQQATEFAKANQKSQVEIFTIYSDRDTLDIH